MLPLLKNADSIVNCIQKHETQKSLDFSFFKYSLTRFVAAAFKFGHFHVVYFEEYK